MDVLAFKEAFDAFLFNPTFHVRMKNLRIS